MVKRDVIPNAVPPLTYMREYVLLSHHQAAGLINLKLVRYCTECFAYHLNAPMCDIQEYYPGILAQGRIKNWYCCTAEPVDVGNVHSEAHDNRRIRKGVGGAHATIPERR